MSVPETSDKQEVEPRQSNITETLLKKVFRDKIFKVIGILKDHNLVVDSKLLEIDREWVKIEAVDPSRDLSSSYRTEDFIKEICKVYDYLHISNASRNSVKGLYKGFQFCLTHLGFEIVLMNCSEELKELFPRPPDPEEKQDTC